MWKNVPEFSNTGSNNFEVSYDCNTGTITLAYGSMTLADALVGITPGGSLAAPVTVFPSLRSNIWGGPFDGHIGFGPESINALYLVGFDLGEATLSFSPFFFGGGLANSYTAF